MWGLITKRGCNVSVNPFNVIVFNLNKNLVNICTSGIESVNVTNCSELEDFLFLPNWLSKLQGDAKKKGRLSYRKQGIFSFMPNEILTA